MLIKVESIVISTAFLNSKPHISKLKKHYDYYNKNNKLMKNIVIDINYQLVDGYIDYIIAMENNISTVECVITKNGYLSKRKYKRDRVMNILMNKSNGTCCICGCKLHTNIHGNRKYYATIDHIIPLSKGGKDNLYNMQATCRRCNLIKSNLLPSDFQHLINSTKENNKLLEVKSHA